MKKINFVSNFLWVLSILFYMPLFAGMTMEDSFIVNFINNIFNKYNLFFKVNITTSISYIFLLLTFILKIYLVHKSYFKKSKLSIIIFRTLCCILTIIFLLFSIFSLLFINMDVSNIPT